MLRISRADYLNGDDTLIKLRIHSIGLVIYLQLLKSELINDHFLPDEVYDAIAELQIRVFHAKHILAHYSHKKYPALAHCWAYHDGLLDACGRILNRRGSGEYSDGNHVMRMIEFYGDLCDRSLEEGHYWNGAYINGYINGLFDLIIHSNEKRDGAPLYLIYGSDVPITTETDLKEALEHSRRRVPKARAKAKKIVANVPEGSVVIHRLSCATYLATNGSRRPQLHLISTS